MQLVDLAWAAGLFEGEGSIYTMRQTKRGLQTPCAALMTTDEDVLRRFHAIVGVGNVYGPYQIKSNKPYWQWQVTSFEKVQHVVAMFWNHLGRRRKDKAKEILAAAKLRPVKSSQRTHCSQGHPFDAGNTSVITRRSGPQTGHQMRACKACARARYQTRPSALQVSSCQESEPVLCQP